MTKNNKTEEFIKKAKELHKDEEGKEIYDYSKVEYIKANKNVTIICKTHGEFTQTPNNHLSERGCRKCGIERNANKKRITLEKFINISKEVHKDEYNTPIYDYSKVEYINCDIKVIIVCKIHGEFSQIPYNHILGFGCSKCGHYKRGVSRRYTIEECLDKFRKIHKNKYDYSKIKYINCDTKITIFCKKHGDFEQTPYNHSRGQGCPKCGIEKASLVKSLTTEQFIDRAKEKHKDKEGKDKYDYSKVEYEKAKIKVIIICKTHGDFEQNPYSHLSGAGCPKCMNKTEGKVLNFLLDTLNEEDVEYQYSPEWAVNENGNKVSYDFYISSINTIFEIDGIQHFNPEFKWYKDQHTKDTEKTRLANENGIYVVRFVQKEIWDDSIEWKEMIIDMLENRISENKFISLDDSKYEMHKEMLN